LIAPEVKLNIQKYCEYRMDAELHLVHQNEEGRFTVVGVLYKLGKSDPILSKVKKLELEFTCTWTKKKKQLKSGD